MEAEPTPLSEHERLKAMVHDLSLRLEEIQFGRKQTNTTVVNQSSSSQSSASPYWSCEMVTNGTVTLATDWDADFVANTSAKTQYRAATSGGELDVLALNNLVDLHCWLVFENSGAAFDASVVVERADGGAAPGLQVKTNEAVVEYTTNATSTITWNVRSGRNRIAVVNEGGADVFKLISLKCKFLTEDNVSWVEGNE